LKVSNPSLVIASRRVVSRIPTELGDVLILRTADTAFSTHVVGRVSKDGQQDFEGETSLQYVRSRADALAKAKALVVPGRRIFFVNIDTGEWSEISS
jgi:hypothetical protein